MADSLLPGGYRIEEDPASHSYYKVYPSGKRERVVSPSQLGQAFKTNIRAPRDAAEAARWEWEGQRGTWFGDKVHEIINARLSGQPEPSRASFRYAKSWSSADTHDHYEDARRAADSMLGELKRLGLDPVASEVLVHDSKTGITGRADLIAKDKAGRLRVVDWKTGKRDPVTGEYPKASYPVQVHTYAGADYMLVNGRWEPVKMSGGTLISAVTDLNNPGRGSSTAAAYDLRYDSHSRKVMREIRDDLIRAHRVGQKIDVHPAVRAAWRSRSATGRAQTTPRVTAQQARQDIEKRRQIPVQPKQKVLGKTTLTRLRQSPGGDKPIMAFDLETTGRGSGARVTEFGAVRIGKDGKFQNLSHKVYRQDDIGPEASGLTGLTPTHLKQGVPINEAELQRIHNMMQGSRVITWNGGGDFDWLANEARIAGNTELAKSFTAMKNNPEIHLDAVKEARKLGISGGRVGFSEDPVGKASSGYLPDNKLITWKQVARAMGRDVSAGSHGAVPDALYTLYALDAIYGQEHASPEMRGEMLRQQLAAHGTQILEGSSREAYEEQARMAAAAGRSVDPYASPLSATSQVAQIASGQGPEPRRQPRGELQSSGHRVRSGVSGTTVNQRPRRVESEAIERASRGGRVNIDTEKSVLIEDSLSSWDKKIKNIEKDLLKTGATPAQVKRLLDPYRKHALEEVWRKDNRGSFASDTQKYQHLVASWDGLVAEVGDYMRRPGGPGDQSAVAYQKTLTSRMAKSPIPVPRIVRAQPPQPPVPPAAVPPGGGGGRGGGGGGGGGRSFWRRLFHEFDTPEGLSSRQFGAMRYRATDASRLTLGNALVAARLGAASGEDTGLIRDMIGQTIRQAGLGAYVDTSVKLQGIVDQLYKPTVQAAYPHGQGVFGLPLVHSDAAIGQMGAVTGVNYGRQYSSALSNVVSRHRANQAVAQARGAAPTPPGGGSSSGDGGGGGGRGRPAGMPEEPEFMPGRNGNPMLMALLGKMGLTDTAKGTLGLVVPKRDIDLAEIKREHGEDSPQYLNAVRLREQQKQELRRHGLWRQQMDKGFATGDINSGGEYATGASQDYIPELDSKLEEATARARAAYGSYLEKEVMAMTKGFISNVEARNIIGMSPELQREMDMAGASGRHREFQRLQKQAESFSKYRAAGHTDQNAWYLARQDYELEKAAQAERAKRDQRRLRSGSRGTVQHLFEQATGSSNPAEYLGKRVTQTAVWASSGMAYYGLANTMGQNWNSIKEVQRDQAALVQALSSASNPLSKFETTKLTQNVMGMSGKYGFAPERIMDVALALQGTMSDADASGAERARNTERATRATVLLSKIGRVDLSESMENMIAISNAYNPAHKAFATKDERQTSNADVMEQAVNGLTALSNKYGVNIEQTSTAMARMGDIFKTMGVDASTSAGWLGAIQRATGESGLQITSKLERVFPELLNPEVGADVARILAPKGVLEYTDLMGEINLTEVMDKIGGAYKSGTINDFELQALGMSIGGPRGYGEFVKLIQNYDTAKDMSRTYGNAGEAAEERWKVLETTAAEQLNKFAGEWLEFAKNVASSGILQTFGLVIGATGKMVAGFNGLFNAVNKFTSWIPQGDTIRNLVGLAAGLKTISAVVNSQRRLGSMPIIGSMVGNSRSPMYEAYRYMNVRQAAHSFFHPEDLVLGAKYSEDRRRHMVRENLSEPESVEDLVLRNFPPMMAGLTSPLAMFRDHLHESVKGLLTFKAAAEAGAAANKLNWLERKFAYGHQPGDATAFLAPRSIKEAMASRWIARNRKSLRGYEGDTMALAMQQLEEAGAFSPRGVARFRMGRALGWGGAGALAVGGMFGAWNKWNTIQNTSETARNDYQREFSGLWASESPQARRDAIFANRERIASMQGGYQGFLRTMPLIGGMYEQFDRTGLKLDEKDRATIAREQSTMDRLRSGWQRFGQGLPLGLNIFRAGKFTPGDEATQVERDILDKELSKRQAEYEKELNQKARKQFGGMVVLAPEDQQFLVQNYMQASALKGGQVLDLRASYTKGQTKQSISYALGGSAGGTDVRKVMEDELGVINYEIAHAAKDPTGQDHLKGLVEWKNKLLEIMHQWDNAMAEANNAIDAVLQGESVAALARLKTLQTQYSNMGAKDTPEAINKMTEMVQASVDYLMALKNKKLSAVEGLSTVGFSASARANNAQIMADTQLQVFQMMQKVMPNSSLTRQAGLEALQGWRNAEDARYEARMSMLDARERLAMASTGNPLQQFAIRRRYIAERMEEVAKREGKASTGNETLDKFLDQLKSEAAAPMTEAADILKMTAEGAMKIAGENQVTAANVMQNAASIMMDAANTIAAAAGVSSGGSSTYGSAGSGKRRGSGGVYNPRQADHQEGEKAEVRYGKLEPGQYIRHPMTGKAAPVGQVWEKYQEEIRLPNGKPTGEFQTKYRLVDVKRKLVHEHENRRPGGSTAKSSGGGGKSGGKSGGGLRATLQQAGFKGAALETAMAIVMAESGGNAYAHNDKYPDNSYGLFQINMLGKMGAQRRAQYGLSSNADLFDPLTNAKVAYAISKGGTNFGPWSTYTNGAYSKHLGKGGSLSRLATGSPSAGNITSPYGMRNGKMHTGIDIDGETGDAIHAAAGGKVVSVKDLGDKSYGKYVVVRGKDGKLYYYAHLSAFGVKQGQSVKAGQTIGAMGATGNATGSHLHFEVRSGGKSVNPAPYMGGGMVGGSSSMIDLAAQMADVARQEAEYKAQVFAAKQLNKAGPASSEKQITATIKGLRRQLEVVKEFGGDPLKVAQLELELKKAYYDKAKLRIEKMTASFMLAKDTSNQVQMYTARIKQIKAEMEAYLEAGGKKTDAEFIQMKSDLEDAKRDKALQKVQYGLDTASYEYKMHEIGFGEYINRLKKLRDTVDTSSHAGLELWRSINEQIQSMLDGMQLNANIPTDIRMPTLYEVRRFIGAQAAGVGYMASTSSVGGYGGPSPITRASGGPFGANELMMVGEAGPELIRFRQGGEVFNNLQTRSMSTSVSNSSQVHIKVDGADTGYILNILSQYLGTAATSRTSFTTRKI